jgi:hypothetical protein
MQHRLENFKSKMQLEKAVTKYTKKENEQPNKWLKIQWICIHTLCASCSIRRLQVSIPIYQVASETKQSYMKMFTANQIKTAVCLPSVSHKSKEERRGM